MTLLQCFVSLRQKCPGLNVNEMHALYDRHHNVSSLFKVHLNTPDSTFYIKAFYICIYEPKLNSPTLHIAL